MNRSALLLALLATACATDEADSPDAYAWLDGSGVQYDVPVPADAEYHPTRVIVGFHDIERPAVIRTVASELPQVRRFESLPAAAYEVADPSELLDTIEELRASGKYRWVEPDYVRTVSVNDPYFSYQWHMDAVGASSAWTQSTGAGTLVAVIDTGVSSGPYDGIGSLTTGYDFANNDSDASDDNGHGTHVAGTIAQATNNGQGVAGLAYDATILPVKVLDRFGSGYTSDVVDGINYAVSQGADVINMSLGSSSYSSTEAAAVYSAYTSGVFVAAASGNSGRTTVDYPAGYPGAVGVGATGYGDYRASYSNRGTDVDLVAPGGDTSVDLNGDGYADGVLQETNSGGTWGYSFFQGTSMAAPHVAAAAALLMAQGATNIEAQDELEATALDLGSTGWDSSYGHGLIQPAAALTSFGGGSGPVDADGDGYDDTTDCDDADASINPGATEVCGDGIDQDCDGFDDVCPGIDADGDGYDDTVDCDDGDASINPGATEVCGDGIDQDCDGFDDTCSTGPTISSVSDSTRRSTRTITWTTDVDTTGEVCNDRGNCATTGLGTSHTARIHKRGSSYTIVATDTSGGTDSVTVNY